MIGKLSFFFSLEITSITFLGVFHLQTNACLEKETAVFWGWVQWLYQKNISAVMILNFYFDQYYIYNLIVSKLNRKRGNSGMECETVLTSPTCWTFALVAVYSTNTRTNTAWIWFAMSMAVLAMFPFKFTGTHTQIFSNTRREVNVGDASSTIQAPTRLHWNLQKARMSCI